MSDVKPRALTLTNMLTKAVPIMRSDAEFSTAWKKDLHALATMCLRIIGNDPSLELQDGCAIDLFKRLHSNPFVKEFMMQVNEGLGVPADFVIPQGTTKEELAKANDLLANSVYDVIVKSNKDIKNLDSKSLDTCNGFEDIAEIGDHPWLKNRAKFRGVNDL